MTLDVKINHRFNGLTVDVQFSAPPGVTALFGPSGSGKTTVINAVAGIFHPDAGRVAMGDTVLLDTARRLCLPPQRRQMGYVFQEARLFPHLTVRQNLLFGRWFSKQPAPEPEVARVIEMLGLGALLSRRPRDLSGGEKSRVALGRALLSSPRLILADEPLAALDEARKAEILPYFERLRDEGEVSILYVSHSPAEVARLATTVVVLERGRVVAQGTAAEVLGDPGITPLGAREAGAMIVATVRAHHPDGLSEVAAGGVPLFLPHVRAAPGQELRLRIAARDVILSRHRPEGLSALNVISGRIAEIRTGQGPGALVALETPAGRILARITQRSVAALGLAAGGDVHAIVKTVSIAPGDVGG
ncbi:Molybdenum transport ATP-binding protein ModC [Roseibacterium elongatum DSM 19469]|uniref:Molybdenum transport ATP-binding protein ModC n=1 Tax=Roseicyclus elongatus DSM 19469 TaxID=1294273 RepID=W8S389_9RHOB|nr:molybdenum ABC transporter ATP-binding protein [Roseibacterium elongatum]AHM04672.1 Molybdenum transport ATP-binding protein ModC [Roseibacterium elongatum DSM 19469]